MIFNLISFLKDDIQQYYESIQVELDREKQLKLDEQLKAII